MLKIDSKGMREKAGRCIGADRVDFFLCSASLSMWLFCQNFSTENIIIELSNDLPTHPSRLNTPIFNKYFFLAMLGLNCCGLFSSCWEWGATLSLWGLFALRHVGSSQTRIKPKFPALAGRFLTTGPPGKPQYSYLFPLHSLPWAPSSCIPS